MANMLVICEWCGTVVKEKDDEGSGHDRTGGICDPCLWEHHPEHAAAVIAEREVRERRALAA